MKNLNFLSNLCGLRRASQSSDAGYDCRSTVVRPSFDCRSTLLKLVTVLVLVLTLGVGQMWAVDPTLTITRSSFSSTPTSYSTVTWSQNTSAGTSISGTSTTCFTNGNTDFQMKNGHPGVSNTTALPGAIKSVTMTRSSNGSNRTVTLYASTIAITSSNYSDATKVTSLGSKTINTSGVTWSLSAAQISAGYKYFYLVGSSNPLYVASIVVTYSEASCSSEITITKGSNPANGTFTINNSGTVCIDAGNASTTVTATPSTHYHLATVTSTGGGSVGVISNNTCTVSNISANTTINVTFEVDPTYTVTWVAGSNPSFSTQTNYAGTALTNPGEPSPASYCPGGKVFVGWTATPIVGEGAEPADLFTSVSGMSIPVGGTTYYAVFATQGGSGSVTKSDELTYTSFFAACSSSGSNTSGSYTNFSSKSGSESDAVYAGNLFKHGNGPSNCKDYIQMRTSSNCGFFTTTSGGKAKKVTIEWNAATTTTRTVDIYGKNTAYSAIADLFNDANKGTLLGSITWASPTPETELSITGDYEYIGIRSNNGALYLSSITIDWQASGGYTYSNYATTCCTPIATISGSISIGNINETGGNASWSWSGATTGISKNILKIYNTSDVLVKTIDNISAAATSQSISGLTPCNTYYATLTTVASSGYCAGEEQGTSSNFTTNGWAVHYTGGDAIEGALLSNVTKQTGASQACLSENYVATFTANTGYELPDNIIVYIAGVEVDVNDDYTWSISNGTGTLTVYTAGLSEEIDVRIIGECVNPVIGTNPASATYQEGASPSALTVAATLGSGTLTYLWKVSTDGGSNWSNAAGTNNEATYSGASLSTASAGTLKFKCVVGNSDGGCSVESTVATITITAAQNFVNGTTVFIQTGNPYSAWDASACVKAWFNNNGAGGAAQTTYWLYDGTGDNNGKKLFATIVPATGNLNQVTLQRFQSNCSDFYNNNGTLTKASDGGSNTFRTVGSGTSDVYWNEYGIILYLYGDPNSWASSLGTFADQLNGVWTATYSNYAPANAAGESQNFKIFTSYNDWIGNTGSNNNATLSGMHVGSTYNVTATLDVKNHSLVMSKTLVSSTVHFDMQSHGSAISDLTSVAAGATISAPSPAPTDAAYDFGGWFKEAGCTNEWNFASDEVEETMTLYAKWTLKTYAITYLPGANGTGTVPAGVKNHGESFTLSSSTFSRDHYTQDGWSTSDGGAKVYELGGSYTTNAALTLYPHWTPANYTVTWHVGDATSTSTVAYNTDFQDITVGKPSVNNNSLSTCESNYFVGWVTSGGICTIDGGTVALYNSNKVNATDKITSDIDFYAMFATSSGGGGAAVNTILWAEDFSGWDDGDVPSGDDITDSHTGTTVYGDATLTYTCVNGGSNTKLYGANNTLYAGGVKPELLVGKIENDIPGSFTVSGIPNGGASEITVSYKQNNKELTVTASGTGYSGSATNTPGSATTESFDVTVGSASTFTLTFAATSTNNVRIDDIEVKVKTQGITYTNYRTNCASCANIVTVSYDAAPTGGTVAVEKGGVAVANNGTVKTCDGNVNLTVTITPASHYTVTGLTAQISSTDMSQSNVDNVYTVTIPQNQSGTLVLTPTLTEDAHIAINWNVNGTNQSIAATHGLTWVYSGEDLTALPSTPSVPAGCTGTKVFAGWSQKHSDATEQNAAWYDDLFDAYDDPTVPTGITSAKTFYAVFATGAAGLGGTVIWDEPFDGDAGDQPSSPTSGATVYGSASIAYNCASTTYCKLYTDNLASGGAASPELLIPKSSRGEAFEITGIPTAGQTELTLTYMAKDALSVTTGTSGVTVGDASVNNKLYMRTITINQNGGGVATFDLTFEKSTDSNSRLDDIHLVVPGSSSMTDYLTLCAPSYTITYNKNTEDPVTNLPTPTSVLQSTGSGTLSSLVPTRYGYTFDGWAMSAGGSVAYAAGAAISSVSADMDLYAKWSVTPVTEINLSKTTLDKYVGDPSVTLSVLSVLPDGANTSVTWSSSNSSIATVNSSTGEVNFIAQGTADIIATSTVTNATTATCAVTVWAKPTVSFLDNLHSLTEDQDGNALSGYSLTDVAGTPVVFPILANQSAGSGTCEDEHYVFVGWTTSDNNTDPEDYLVTSHNLTNGDNITYYAVWADGVAGTTYTKLASNLFNTSKHYVLGAEYNGTTKYFYSCEKTDKNNSWGYVTADLASNTPIEFTLSGTAAALVATSTEVSARYLKPLTEKDFQMSASSQTVELKSDGTIYNPSTDWKLLYNNANSLRWYDSPISGSANAYFYEVVAGGEVNYRTSCCADKVAAPTVTATKTSTTVTLTWAAVSDATGYELQWNGGAWTAATSGVVKSDLTPNTNYSWRVRATYDPPKCGADIASGNTTTNQVYHVTYAKGSGTGSCNATSSTTDDTAYEAGATVTLQSNGFTLVGHTFNEWTEDDEDITISSNQFTMPEHDVVITATWTPKVDKFYDRMHDGTDASHGGTADGDGKYYITREGCSYTVPSLTDNTSGATACHTKHYVLMGWTAESHLNSDGTLKTGHEGYVYTGGGTQTATGATYYAVWAEVEE